jgi:membrane-associated phospholipid phosphatase
MCFVDGRYGPKFEMKTTAVKSPGLRSGLLMAMVSLGVTCFAQPQGRQQQPMGTTQASANEAGSQAAQSGESALASSAGNSQMEAGKFTESRLGLSLLKNIALDQEAIWTSPARLRWADGSWLFPLSAVTAGFFATDRAVPGALSTDPNKLNRYTKISDYGTYAMVGAGGGLYLWSKLSHDDHQRETGILAGEAAIDSLAVDTTFKYAFGRERPNQGHGLGDFFQHGVSFPSEHSAAVWSIASVIAHEYPGPLSQLAVYGLATAVSASRVVGKTAFSFGCCGGRRDWVADRPASVSRAS